LNPESLRHLLEAFIRVEFTIKDFDSLVYKRCELTNSKQYILRAPRERSNIPFDKISWDVIYIRDGLGGEKRVFYTIDDYTRIHFVYTLLNNKIESLIKCLESIAAYVFRQYKLIIRFWRHDNLPTLMDSTRYSE
jgi:hypothetical protein